MMFPPKASCFSLSLNFLKYSLSLNNPKGLYVFTPRVYPFLLLCNSNAALTSSILVESKEYKTSFLSVDRDFFFGFPNNISLSLLLGGGYKRPCLFTNICLLNLSLSLNILLNSFSLSGY